MDQKQKVYEMLNSLNIEYKVVNHPAAFTVDDLDELKITQYGDVCKNLFLRDAKGEKHFLVVMHKDKMADLKSIQKQLDCTRLSFASEERLMKYLGLRKGEVTPLAVVNDPDAKVDIVFDRDLINNNNLGFHPNDNTSTVFLSYDSLKKIILHNGNNIDYVTL